MMGGVSESQDGRTAAGTLEGFANGVVECHAAFGETKGMG